ncbi:glycoside hydrolase family 25 protein [Cupriavidus basilensis]
MPKTFAALDIILDIHHDQPFNAQEVVDAGVVAVIHKASEGATWKDKTYLARREQALKAGLLWGAYHFSSSKPALDQLTNFLEAVDWKNKNLDHSKTLFCLDFEPSTSGPDMTIDQAHEFVTKMKEVTGRWPMIYGGNMLRDSVPHHGADPILKNCPLWYARYTDTPLGIPVDTWPKFTLWQYTDGKHGPAPHAFNGMEALDRSCYVGPDSSALRNAWPFADYFKSAPAGNEQNA